MYVSAETLDDDPMIKSHVLMAGRAAIGVREADIRRNTDVSKVPH